MNRIKINEIIRNGIRPNVSFLRTAWKNSTDVLPSPSRAITVVLRSTCDFDLSVVQKELVEDNEFTIRSGIDSRPTTRVTVDRGTNNQRQKKNHGVVGVLGW